MITLNPGDQAPDFASQDQHGQTVRLSDLRGQRVALYFYPKDDTPGCTAQACSLRDGETELKAAGITVLGVSPDTGESHQRFAQKYELPFQLLADPDKQLAQAYGVWQEKKNYGRTYWGVVRTTFLIDADGRVERIIRRPDTKNHAAQLLK